MISALRARAATLRWRLTLFYCTLLAVLLAAVGIFVYTRFDAALMDNARSRMQDQATLLTMTLPKGVYSLDSLKQGTAKIMDLSQALQTSFSQTRGSTEYYLALLDPQGRPLITNQPALFVLPAAVHEAQSATTVVSGPPVGIRHDPAQELVKPGTFMSILTPTLQPPVPPSAIGKADSGYFYETTMLRTQSPPGESTQARALVYIIPLWLASATSESDAKLAQAIADGLGPISLADTTPESSAAPQVGGYLVLAASLSDVDSALGQLRFFLLTGLLGAVGIALLLGLPLARLGLRPLARIAATATAIGHGDLSRRVALPRRSAPATASDEMQQLAQAFNTMLDKIEAAFTAQQASEARTRRFAADASHELRSPLTVLGGYLDVLLMGAKDDPVQEARILHAMQHENDRLGRLVVDLLLLTRMDANGAGHLRRAPLLLAEVVTRAVDNMRLLAGARTLELVLVPPAAAVVGDADHLYRVLVNLLDNALRYTGPDGHIVVTLDFVPLPNGELGIRDQGSGEARDLVPRPSYLVPRPNPQPPTPNPQPPSPAAVRLRVADDGCGIAPEELPRIFDRFYRADPSRARQTGNAGLGLAIVKSIVEAHGGAITVASTLDAGTCFTLTLPLCDPPPAGQTLSNLSADSQGRPSLPRYTVDSDITAAPTLVEAAARPAPISNGRHAG